MGWQLGLSLIVGNGDDGDAGERLIIAGPGVGGSVGLRRIGEMVGRGEGKVVGIAGVEVGLDVKAQADVPLK